MFKLMMLFIEVCILIFCVVALISLSSKGNNVKNTNWFKIERNDATCYLGINSLICENYYFTEDIVKYSSSDCL